MDDFIHNSGSWGENRLMTLNGRCFQEIAVSIYIYIFFLKYTYIYCVNIFIEMYIYIYIYVHLCCIWDISLYIFILFRQFYYLTNLEFSWSNLEICCGFWRGWFKHQLDMFTYTNHVTPRFAFFAGTSPATWPGRHPQVPSNSLLMDDGNCNAMLLYIFPKRSTNKVNL